MADKGCLWLISAVLGGAIGIETQWLGVPYGLGIVIGVVAMVLLGCFLNGTSKPH